MSRSLIRQAQTRVAVRIALVVLVATVISFLHVRHSLEEQALAQLAGSIGQRGVRESAPFLLARDNLKVFAEHYENALRTLGDSDPRERFQALFQRHPDGSLRLRLAVFNETGITGVIGKHVPVDADLRRRLVAALELLSRFGPAWRNRFVNLYVTTPENAVLMYWPDKPWALDVSDWEVNAKLALTAPEDSVLVTDQRAPREATWSDLYFDYGVDDWLLSATEPVNLDGQYQLSVGHDVPLDRLIQRTLSHHLDGTYNLLFREDGRLIAHPRLMEAIQASSGKLAIPGADDPHLSRIYRRVLNWDGETPIIANPEDREFLAVTRLAGPGWYLVTVFPEALVNARAYRTARLILGLGLVALLLELAILATVLRRQVAEPLTGLMAATRRVAAGDYNLQLDEQRDDEIGQLAHSLNRMSRELNHREAALQERREALETLNRQLAAELQERCRAEAEVIRQREALHQSEKMNALGSLLAGVAHELNNPLSVVVGRSLILEEELRHQPAGPAIARVREAAERCARIVKTFLAMARQEKPTRVELDLKSLLKSALELVGYGLKADGVVVELDLPAHLPALHADPDQLVQVFTNLLVNAQQAMNTRLERRLRISACALDGGRAVAVTVSDTGPGVAPEIAHRIFEPFFTTKGVGEGTGVGLSVSHGILQAHGGCLRLTESELGGASFQVLLPAGRGGEVMETPGERPVPADAAPGRAILVVDDEPEVAALMADILGGAGYRVITAASGRAALGELQRAPVDLVISDLRMPDLDGRGLYAALRVDYPALSQRMVFVTGDTLNDSARDFLAGTGCRVLDKPFVPAQVRQTVAEMLAVN